MLALYQQKQQIVFNFFIYLMSSLECCFSIIQDFDIEMVMASNDKRSIVEVCHSWFNNLRKLKVRYEKQLPTFLCYIALRRVWLYLRRLLLFSVGSKARGASNTTSFQVAESIPSLGLSADGATGSWLFGWREVWEITS